jgi:dihydrolipoamide dehydrogenase
VAELSTWTDGVVDRLTGGVAALCREHGVDVCQGLVRFEDEHVVRISPVDPAAGGPDGTTGGDDRTERAAGNGTAERDDGGAADTRLAFEHAVLATGSRPIELPGFPFGDGPIVSSREALSLPSAPDRLLVVGAGYIGMELSTVFARLGTDVTVVEVLDSVLPTYDDELTRPVHEHAEGLSVDFRFGERACEWEPAVDGPGAIVTTETEDGGTADYRCDRVLVAVGRRPVTDTLGLSAVGLEPDEDGFLATDDRCRTALDHVFAVGDVAGEPMLAHAASMEGLVAAEVATGGDATTRDRAIPAAVFTEPEIGTVGLGPAAAAEAGHDPVVGRFPLSASGRALAGGYESGFVRLVADGSSGRVLGGQAVGPDASELVAELSLAVEVGATLDDVARTVHPHPTLAEAVGEAAEHAGGLAIHTVNR